ncbi:MAG TPA: hypothetical protein VI160_07875 [Gemmatimonadales bacterium]
MPTKTSKKAGTFTAEERAAMRERVRELKAGESREAGERELLAAIKRMPDADRVRATRVHAIVSATAPSLAPKTWYGMPAYANAEGKVVCFYQSAQKFKTRYATLGFSDQAHLDDGTIWPTVFALTTVSAAEAARITALVKKAVS